MNNIVPFDGQSFEPLSNIEAEAAFLGAILIDNSALARAGVALTAAHFFEPLHARIFERTKELIASGVAVSSLTLRPYFEADDAIKELGGVVYLSRLTADGKGLLAVRSLAEQIHELAWRRQARDGLQSAARDCLDLSIAPEAISAFTEARIGYAPTKRLEELPGAIDPGEWAGLKSPIRRFIIPGWIVRGSCGLLSGQEGVGKSLIAQQMATCAALGLTFLGLDICQANVVYITCEDPIEELWRRQENINAMLGVTMADLAGKLKLVSLKGVIGNELGTYDTAGLLTPSARYRQIETAARDFKAGVVFLDNAAHLFPGNENARHDVAVFLGLLEKLSEVIDGAVILLAHPNKQHSQGNKQGNEYSGSTGWSAHVRNRLFLDWAEKDDAGNFMGDDGRVLRKSKANYGKKGEEVYLRWHEWAFLRDQDLPADVAAQMREIGRANFENECFVSCLKQRTAERRPVSENPASRTFAPKMFAEMPEARRCNQEQLTQAMDRLFRLKTIKRDFLWVDKGEGKARHGLKLVDSEPAYVSADLSADLPLTSADRGDDL